MELNSTELKLLVPFIHRYFRYSQKMKKCNINSQFLVSPKMENEKWTNINRVRASPSEYIHTQRHYRFEIKYDTIPACDRRTDF